MNKTGCYPVRDDMMDKNNEEEQMYGNYSKSHRDAGKK